MRQLDSFADKRLLAGCVYCGGRDDTREHVPSRALLDAPYPENLPVVGACRKCNAGFSSDEEYVSCLLEVVVAGSTDPAKIRREKIARTLEHSAPLRHRLDAARSVTATGTVFRPEFERVQRVLAKLATGHAAYELERANLGDPSRIWWHPLALLGDEDRDAFEAPEPVDLYGEVGSRNMQRLVLAQFALESESGERTEHQMLINDWVEVQAERYRYHTSDDGERVCVRMVLAGYLAAEVEWDY